MEDSRESTRSSITRPLFDQDLICQRLWATQALYSLIMIYSVPAYELLAIWRGNEMRKGLKAIQGSLQFVLTDDTCEGCSLMSLLNTGWVAWRSLLRMELIVSDLQTGERLRSKDCVTLKLRYDGQET